MVPDLMSSWSERDGVALVHEWVAERAGSEKVFERLAVVLSSADLYALSVQPGVDLQTSGRRIATTWLDREFWRSHRAASLPLMPIAWSRLRPQDSYDLVVTSAHAFAREFVGRRKTGRHLCYVHAPMRYAWERTTDPRTSSRLAALPAALLRGLDLRTVEGVDSFAANSSVTRDRIRLHYGRDAEVIHPPVDTRFFGSAVRDPQGYLLAFGRFVGYKRFDLAIAVAEKAGMPLRIAGSGPLEALIRSQAERASVHVAIEVRPSDQRILHLFEGASALLFPGVEDFGIIPVEAQSAGVPVVGPAAGGLMDTVRHLETGALADEQTVESLALALHKVLGGGIGGAPCRRWAQTFVADRFDAEIVSWLDAYGS